jgi:leucyl-tRNA synthetase
VIIERFGADTARWFVLSDNPPERDVEWTEAGVQGSYRFVLRLAKLVEQIASVGRPDAVEAYGAEAKKLRQLTHRTIAAVTEALETFTFNVAVAKLYELANGIAGLSGDAPDVRAARFEGASVIVQLVAPIMPHLAEHLFAKLAPNAGLVASQPWPEPDPALLVVDEVTMAVQVNGKLRGTIIVPAGQRAEINIAAAKEAVSTLLAGQTIVKQIHVPDRIVNFVVKPS